MEPASDEFQFPDGEMEPKEEHRANFGQSDEAAASFPQNGTLISGSQESFREADDHRDTARKLKSTLKGYNQRFSSDQESPQRGAYQVTQGVTEESGKRKGKEDLYPHGRGSGKPLITYRPERYSPVEVNPISCSTPHGGPINYAGDAAGGEVRRTESVQEANRTGYPGGPSVRFDGCKYYEPKVDEVRKSPWIGDQELGNGRPYHEETDPLASSRQMRMDNAYRQLEQANEYYQSLMEPQEERKHIDRRQSTYVVPESIRLRDLEDDSQNLSQELYDASVTQKDPGDSCTFPTDEIREWYACLVGHDKDHVAVGLRAFQEGEEQQMLIYCRRALGHVIGELLRHEYFRSKDTVNQGKMIEDLILERVHVWKGSSLKVMRDMFRMWAFQTKDEWLRLQDERWRVREDEARRNRNRDDDVDRQSDRNHVPGKTDLAGAGKGLPARQQSQGPEVPPKLGASQPSGKAKGRGGTRVTEVTPVPTPKQRKPGEKNIAGKKGTPGESKSKSTKLSQGAKKVEKIHNEKTPASAGKAKPTEMRKSRNLPAGETHAGVIDSTTTGSSGVHKGQQALPQGDIEQIWRAIEQGQVEATAREDRVNQDWNLQLQGLRQAGTEERKEAREAYLGMSTRLDQLSSRLERGGRPEEVSEEKEPPLDILNNLDEYLLSEDSDTEKVTPSGTVKAEEAVAWQTRYALLEAEKDKRDSELIQLRIAHEEERKRAQEKEAQDLRDWKSKLDAAVEADRIQGAQQRQQAETEALNLVRTEKEQLWAQIREGREKLADQRRQDTSRGAAPPVPVQPRKVTILSPEEAAQAKQAGVGDALQAASQIGKTVTGAAEPDASVVAGEEVPGEVKEADKTLLLAEIGASTAPPRSPLLFTTGGQGPSQEELNQHVPYWARVMVQATDELKFALTDVVQDLSSTCREVAAMRKTVSHSDRPEGNRKPRMSELCTLQGKFKEPTSDQTWGQWSQKLATTAVNHGLDEKDTAQVMHGTLSGRAARYLSEALQNNGMIAMSSTEMVLVLDEKFEGKRVRKKAAYALKECYQFTGEAVKAYGERVSALAQQAHPRDRARRKEAWEEQMIEGLLDVSIRMQFIASLHRSPRDNIQDRLEELDEYDVTPSIRARPTGLTASAHASPTLTVEEMIPWEDGTGFDHQLLERVYEQARHGWDVVSSYAMVENQPGAAVSEPSNLHELWEQMKFIGRKLEALMRQAGKPRLLLPPRMPTGRALEEYGNDLIRNLEEVKAQRIVEGTATKEEPATVITPATGPAKPAKEGFGGRGRGDRGRGTYRGGRGGRGSGRGGQGRGSGGGGFVPTGKCHQCGREGHWRRECPNKVVHFCDEHAVLQQNTVLTDNALGCQVCQAETTESYQYYSLLQGYFGKAIANTLWVDPLSEN